MRPRTLLVLALLSAAAACDKDATTPRTAQPVREMEEDQVLYGVKHSMTSEGIRRAVLLGDSAYVRDAGNRLDLSGVKLDFFNEVGLPAGKLTSRSGEYNPTTGDFVARGNVILITKTPQGERRLETEELHYEPNSDQIWSPVPFVLHEDGKTSRGQSFRSDTQFRNFTIQGAQGSIPSAEIRF